MKLSDLLKLISHVEFIGNDNAAINKIVPLDEKSHQPDFIRWVNNKKTDN